ncbi:MAG: DUF2891 domain-containing protein [Planctomycetia bacterium]|nr:DUF2891 domain-containing protein [Planctomycetia bacterium]
MTTAAASFARVALANVTRPYPHKFDHLTVAGPEPEVGDHVALHPVFFGSYDWHSAVHMHWLLARLLRLHEDVPEAAAIAALFDDRLAVGPLAVERAYLGSPAGKTFERPYGWAWLLELRAELERLCPHDKRAYAWAAALDPLAGDLAERCAAFVGSAPYPIRAGTHGNTAFAAILALDFARTCGHAALEATIQDAAIRWHAADRDAAVAYEPSLTDFLSPILATATLMGLVLPETSFTTWFDQFLPRGLGCLAEPPRVVDRHDPQIAHLDGLCLSRAWMLRRIASGLPAGYPRTAELLAAADVHLEGGLPRTVGGDYVGEHWLASFAALALGDVP